MRSTYLGLGSNKGNREKNLIRAVELIGMECAVLDYSSMYCTAPVGCTEQPFFLNMVIKVDSARFTPTDLLNLVKSIELKMGRKKTFRWGPRLIDIDILYIEGFEVDTEELTVPHRELFNRCFVLVPLSELAESIIVGGKEMPLSAAGNRSTVRYDVSGESGGSVVLHKSREVLKLRTTN